MFLSVKKIYITDDKMAVIGYLNNLCFDKGAEEL